MGRFGWGEGGFRGVCLIRGCYFEVDFVDYDGNAMISHCLLYARTVLDSSLKGIPMLNFVP